MATALDALRAANNGTVQALVVDCGSGMCKAGFAGDDTPCASFPAIVRRPRRPPGWPVIGGQKDAYVGDEASGTGRGLVSRAAMQRGVVANWDDMEKIWHHTFYNELHVAPEEHPVLLSEHPAAPRADREKTMQLMFETFNTPACYLKSWLSLSLYSAGRVTGVVLDSGDQCTHVAAVFGELTNCESNVVTPTLQSADLGGGDLTDYLMRMLNEKGCGFTTSAERECTRDIKEKLCTVALDFENEAKRAAKPKPEIEATYEMPDGQKITIAKERLLPCEALFRPSLLGSEHKGPGIHQMIYTAIQRKAPLKLAAELYGAVVLTGGNTMFPGLQERLDKELKVLAPAGTTVKVVAGTDRKYGVWVGGSILASLTSFSNAWALKEEYEEIGPHLATIKCV